MLFTSHKPEWELFSSSPTFCTSAESSPPDHGIDSVPERNRVRPRTVSIPLRRQMETKKENMPALQHMFSFFYIVSPIRTTQNVEAYSSPNNSSIIWQAALATDVPGPKMAATPAL